MTTTLPSGLVSHTDVVGPELRRVDCVDTEDIAKLWRVYTTNRSTLYDDTGRRLENLFWRIWSSERIISTIRGSTIARLLLHISDGPSSLPEIEQIWNRMRQKKKKKKKARITDAEPEQSSSTVHSPPSSPSATRLDSSESSFRQPQQHGTSKRALIPAPILKKSRSPDDQPKNKQTLSSGETATDTASSQVRGQATESKGTPSPPRKRTTFTTTLESLVEQTPSPSLAQESSRRLAVGVHQTDHSTQPEAMPAYPQNRSEQSVPSEQDQTPKSLQSPIAADQRRSAKIPSKPEPEPTLVEKNFRRKFVESQRRVTTPTSGSPTGAFGYQESPSSSLLSPQLPPIPPLPAAAIAATEPQAISAARTAQSPFPAFPPDRLSARSTFTSPAPRSMPLSRSSSVQTGARQPVQSQLSKLLEREKEMGSQHGRKRGDSEG